MDHISMNRYEKQLYAVFKTFDVNNEEALDRSSVLALCDALQLEHRGSALADTLFECRGDRVTFTQFRNGLLEVLGAPPAAPAAASPAAADLTAASAAPSDAPSDSLLSDDDSSGREVAPKFVFGSKKYGRRSRPARSADADAGAPRSSSASRLHVDEERASHRARCRRSVSAMESRDDDTDEPVAGAFEHDRRIDRDEALALCRGLNMDGIDRHLVDRIFDDSGADDTTVGEFFDRLNASLTTSIEEASRETSGLAPDVSDDETTPADVVLEAWRRGRVPRAHLLLARLGFRAHSLRLADLERALDDDLRAHDDAAADQGAPERVASLAAALALSRLRLEGTRRRAAAAVAERDKLRADVADTNRRAALLAQEVDESHARLEAELQATLRRAEARHTDASRRAAADVAAERERAVAALARLEAEEARRAEAEARARAAVEEARERCAELEVRAAEAEARAAEAERERERAAGELLAERARAAGGARDGAAGALEAALREARREAAALRDRCDELCAALEARAAPPAPPPASPPPRAAPLRAELHQEGASSPASLDSVAATASVDAAAQTNSLEDVADEERDRLTTLVSELEASLEAMRDEYERCEEYWSGKLSEERALLADEQRQSDERLAELVARVAEYERQFGGAALPPIEERAQLEAQVTDLQDETARHAAAAAASRRARDEAQARARRLEAECAREAEARREAERRLAAERAPARELRARTARAEAAARRLLARLAAADLLVKELFVENCQRACRPPL